MSLDHSTTAPVLRLGLEELGIEPKTSCMLSKRSTPELHPLRHRLVMTNGPEAWYLTQAHECRPGPRNRATEGLGLSLAYFWPSDTLRMMSLTQYTPRIQIPRMSRFDIIASEEAYSCSISPDLLRLQICRASNSRIAAFSVGHTVTRTF